MSLSSEESGTKTSNSKGSTHDKTLNVLFSSGCTLHFCGLTNIFSQLRCLFPCISIIWLSLVLEEGIINGKFPFPCLWMWNNSHSGVL